MRCVDQVWFTGEHGQQLEPAEKSRRSRSGKLPAGTQAAIDDINLRYPGELNDDIPEL